MKYIIGCFLLSLLLFPLNAGAKSFYSDGTVDNSSGTPNKDLVYRDFDISQDGYITGYIINISNHPLKSVRFGQSGRDRDFMAKNSQYRRHGP
jgi:hypothetical protein